MAFNGLGQGKKKSEEAIKRQHSITSLDGQPTSSGSRVPLLPSSSLEEGQEARVPLLPSALSQGGKVPLVAATSTPIIDHGSEAATSRFMAESFAMEPVLSRETHERDDNVTRLSFLHDEVDKLFDHDWRFDPEVTPTHTDPNVRPSGQSALEREPSKVALTEFYHVDEAEYSRHRRVSYPHVHQPLRSLSNKSLSKSTHRHKAKKKKKKKKRKEKRVFPSRSAIKSPPIPEEEEQDDSFLDDDDDDSTSSSDFYEDSDTAPPFNGSKSAPNVASMSDQYPTDKSPMAAVPTGEPPFIQVDNVDATPSSVSKPSHLNVQPVGFYLGSDIPSPTEDIGALRFMESGVGPIVDLQSPTGVEGSPTDHSLARETLSVPATDATAVLMDESGLQRVQSVAAQKFKRTISQEPQTSPMFHGEGEGEEPLLSPHRLAPGLAVESFGDTPPVSRDPSARRLSTGGKVTFVVGDDSTYTNLNSLHEVSDEESTPLVSEAGRGEEEKENTHGKRRKKKHHHHHHRRDSEGDQDQDHKLSRVPSEGNQSTRSSTRRRHHHHHEHFKQEDLIMRRQRGSEVHLDESMHKSPTETEEAMTLYKADLDEMASHRFEDQRGIRRHKIARKKGAFQSIVHIGKVHQEKRPRVTKKYDHKPHEVFVELDELHVGGEDMWEWREKARWIKFEEDVEEGAERWGKPHVASLSFHSLLELRRALENGSLLLDLEATDLTSIIHCVVENLVIRDLVEEEVKGKLLRTLLLKHKHQQEKGLLNSFSQSSFGSSLGLNKSPSQTSVAREKKRRGSKQAAKLEMVKVDVDNNMTDKTSDGIHIAVSPVEEKKHIQDIMRRIPKGSEASTVLVGQVDFLKKPAMAFVRLAEGQVLDNLTEVPLPVRFLFVLIGPEGSGMDYHEVGRSLSTLMSNQQFHDVAYRAESRDDLLRAINGFLDDSIVLPPGDWDHRTLLPITHMARRRAQIRRQKKERLEKEALLEKGLKEDIPTDPLQRTRCLFGGLVNDVKRRYPYYLSDVRDAANWQSFLAILFIFFTCLSPCIAFGGLLSEKTHGLLGVSETMIATSAFGMFFSLFSGQPLLVLGATGPVLVYEETIFKVCDSYGVEFLSVRFWIGFWVCFITLVTVALEGSFLVRYISRFTEEIFAILISLVFIYEVVKKLMKIFSQHPLMESYCDLDNGTLHNASDTPDLLSHLAGNASNESLSDVPGSSMFGGHSKGDQYDHSEPINQPNTALLSLILTLGTFLIAHFLRVFRNSKFLGRSVRRALGDFGVLIALICMVLLSFIMNKTYVQKLDITDPFTPTSSSRGWLIHPMGQDNTITVQIVFLCIIPAFLIFILLFMETQITEMILNKKERKLEKGPGFHLDQMILGVLTFFGGAFGLPWMCAATVRTVAHISALSIYSRTHAPGEKPQLLGVKEQRVTNFAVHLLIGLSTLLGPVLREIPVASLFGVFLYLGVSAMSGVQMFERIKLLLMPIKYHPAVGYVRKVPMQKMHKFTLIQLACLIVLGVVKSTPAALIFPLLLVLLVPLRLKGITHFFKETELAELDKEEEDLDLDDEDDPDFYQQAHMPI